MNSSNAWKAAVVAAALGAAATIAAQGADATAPPRGMHGPMGGPGMMPGAGTMGLHMLDRMSSELGLSDAQKQTIKGLFESSRPDMERMGQQARDNAELLRSTKPDSPDYKAAVARASRTAGELASEAVNHAANLRAQVWNVLTPEQRVKLDAMREERVERFRERRESRRAPSP